MAKMLVEAGAKLDAKNTKGHTPLDVAAQYGNRVVAEYLSEKSGLPIPKMKEKKKKTTKMMSPIEPPKPENLTN